MPSSFVREYSAGLTLSVAGHGVLFLLLGLNLILMPDTAMQPVQLAIEATVIDTAEIRRRQAEDQRRQQELERQRQQAEAEQREQQEAERQKAEQTRIAEQRKKEAAERERQEVERKQQEAERKQQEAEQKKAEEQRRQAEQARIAEQRKKEEAERQRQEAEKARRQAEMQANLQSELEAEEQRLAAINSGKLAQYIGLIADRVERNWVQPSSARPGVECVVHVTQIPGGEVVNVRIGRCNGDAAVIRSIEAAVYRASPLPTPSEPSLFERNLRFTFKPEE
ncbi:MAG: cell envelope integrity protein TolA [Gammaproteobacteria bacterium]|nr:cell envelope integrity protein TolA [Gammaproteobacteria bacterium]